MFNIMSSDHNHILEYLRLGEITARVVRAPIPINHHKGHFENTTITQISLDEVLLLKTLTLSIRMAYIQGCLDNPLFSVPTPANRPGPQRRQFSPSRSMPELAQQQQHRLS
jgi:hypothetical protein